MADANFKPSSGDDLVLSNDDASAKIEINEDGTIVLTGSPTLPTTSFGDNNITNVGDIAVDTISSDAGTSIGVTLGTDAGDDFNVGSGKFVVEGDTGRVGVGTDEPRAEFHVQSNEPYLMIKDNNAGTDVKTTTLSSRSGKFHIDNWNDAHSAISTANILVADLSTGNVGIGLDAPIADLQISESGASEVRLQMTNSNTGQGVGDGFALVLSADASVLYFWNYEGRDMIFSPDGSNQFKIASDGKLFSLPTANNTSPGGANVYMISGTGEFHLSTSSKRYKTNIVDTAKGLNELLTLRPVDFNSTCKSADPNRLWTGFIAEEVEAAGFEEYTDVNANDEVDSVFYGNMVALCVKAIQELSTKVTALEKT